MSPKEFEDKLIEISKSYPSGDCFSGFSDTQCQEEKNKEINTINKKPKNLIGFLFFKIKSKFHY